MKKLRHLISGEKKNQAPFTNGRRDQAKQAESLPAPPPQPHRVQLSEKGAEFICREEGFRAKPYDDSQGHATIGIGHLIAYGRVSSLPAAERRQVWTLKRALDQLRIDAERNGLAAIRANIHVPLEPHEVDALTSLCFNCGPGAIAAGHSVTVAVNSKPHGHDPGAVKPWHDRVAAAFLLWAHPSELLGRRHREIALFCNGTYK